MSMSSCSSFCRTMTGRCEARSGLVTRSAKAFACMKASSSARSSTLLYGGEYISVDERHGLRRDAFAAADEAELLGGGRLDVDGSRRHAEVRGDVGDHARHVRRHARLLGDDRGVEVDDLEAQLFQFPRNVAQQPAAVNAGVAGIAVGIMPPDVAKARGAEQRVADRVRKHVGVGMPQQALVMRDLDAADDELAPLGERMHIEALPDSHRRLARMAAAIVRSSA